MHEHYHDRSEDDETTRLKEPQTSSMSHQLPDLPQTDPPDFYNPKCKEDKKSKKFQRDANHAQCSEIVGVEDNVTEEYTEAKVENEPRTEAKVFRRLRRGRPSELRDSTQTLYQCGNLTGERGRGRTPLSASWNPSSLLNARGTDSSRVAGPLSGFSRPRQRRYGRSRPLVHCGTWSFINPDHPLLDVP